MNTTNNVHAFIQSEQVRKNKKERLLTIEQACQAKKAPEGVPTVKKPKLSKLDTWYVFATSKKEGLRIKKWCIFAEPTEYEDTAYVSNPFLSPDMYMDSRKEAREKARLLNNVNRRVGRMGYRVARVTVSVSFAE